MNKLKKLLKISLSSLLISGLFSSCMKNAEPDSNSQKSSIIIPYIQKVGNQVDLYVMDLNGRNKRKLTDDAFEEADPTYLPNGKVLFSSKRTGTWQIYTIDINGKNLNPVTSDRSFNNYRPSLSIDGRVVFISDRDVKPKVFSMDFDGGSLLQLTDDDYYADHPSPLDDGTILFLSNKENKWEIWRMNADGKNKQKITSISSNPLSLSAMPGYVRDSLLRTPTLNDNFVSRRNMVNTNLVPKAVFTARNSNDDLEIYRINIDGTDLRNLTEMPGVDANPVVLKNGKIAFTSDRDGTFNVWIMEPDGYNPMNLTREPYYASTR